MLFRHRPGRYAGNNPIIFVDPTGKFFFSAFIPILVPIMDAATWDAVIGRAGYTASVAFSPGGLSNWNIGNFVSSLDRGAISGAVTFGIGEFAQSTEGGYAFSTLAGGTGSALTGGNFWEGAAIGMMNFGLNKVQQSSKEPLKIF